MKLRVHLAIWLYALAATSATAQVKVSDLPAASVLSGTEVVPGVQGGTSKKISVAQIGTYVTGALPLATTSTDGLQSAADKTKLNGIATGATANTGTVTSVAALTLGTTGTDLSSNVANGTTAPVITLNVPSASAANRGALLAADWSTFNGKQAALVSGTNIKTVGGFTLLGSGDVGTIPAANGGTGQATYAVGDILAASTTSALSRVADVATGNALLSGGVGVLPTWGKVGLTTHVSGTLPVANGGTGTTTSTGTVSAVLSTKPQFANTIGVGVAANASGSGVSFPSTQAASTDPNTLDDYAEGTWTPTITAGTGTITTASGTGYYTKVGRAINYTISVSITAAGTGAGALNLSLPFTSMSGAAFIGGGRETATSGVGLTASIFTASATAAVFTATNTTVIATGANVTISGTYFQ